MTRRKFVRLSASAAGLALASGACGFTAPWARPRIPRIGYLSPAYDRDVQVDFLQGLADLGYVDGQNIAIEWRFTSANQDAYSELPQLAAELVRLGVDLIVTASTPAAQIAQQTTSTIPILATQVVNPMETGLVASLQRPGANLTAFANTIPGIEAKFVELLQDLVPNLANVVVLVDPGNPVFVLMSDGIRGAAAARGIQAQRVDLRLVEELDAAFETPEFGRAQALLIANGILQTVAAPLADLALKHRLPSAANSADFVRAGLLMNYGANLPAVSGAAGVYVDRILKGAHAGDLPVQRPTRFDLSINVKTLQALGLTIPPSMLPLVTEWIQ